MPFVDLDPATARVAAVVAAVPDDALDGPTPCADYTVAALVDHIAGLTLAFTAAAAKAPNPPRAEGPSGDRARLGDDWRARIPRDLAVLAEAWREPSAWSGPTQVRGLKLPGDVAGLFALNELVVHGWDLAVATGQAYAPGEEELGPVIELVTPLAAPDQPARPGLFGPAVAVDPEASLLDRLLGLTGRDPAWSPA